jgi:glycosyltransferase involved in cell wall biosynthesis
LDNWVANHRLPENIKLLGYVSNQKYINHLFSCDFTVVLTEQELTLNCGAYESLAAEKPMLLSDTKTIRSYFSFGANYIKGNSISGMRKEITSLTSQLDSKEEEIKGHLPKIKADWRKFFKTANEELTK